MVIAAIFITITIIIIIIIIYRRFDVVSAHQQCVVVDGLFVDASNVNVSERSIPGLDAILRDQLPAAPMEAVVIGSTSGPSNRKAIWTQLGYSAHFSERSPGQGEAFVDDALVAHMQRVILSAKPGANLSRHLIVLATGDGGENDGRPSFKSAVEGALKVGFNVKLICYRPNPVYRRFAAEFSSQLQIVEINSTLSSWCLAAAGDISLEVPLSIKLSPSGDDGAMNMQVAKAVQKEAMAVAMRSGNVQKMRELADKLQKSSAAEEFKGDIELLLQLAKDFEDRRDDARMNSLQMAQECSNNRSMQSASRFVSAKSAMCSPSIVHRSFAATSDVSEKMKTPMKTPNPGAAAAANIFFAAPSTPPPTVPRALSAQKPGTPEKGAPGVVSSVLSSIGGFAASLFGSSSAEPDMQ